MNKFLALSVFVRVVENGGFTMAARKLGISVSAANKAIVRLEDELGVRLLNRTTRHVSTTEYGQEFYERSVRILADLEEAELSLQAGHKNPKGKLRVIVPYSFGRVTLVPELPRFSDLYPDITLQLFFSDSDKPLDLVSEGYDVAVRTGEIADSLLVTRVLVRCPMVTVASPAYLRKHGIPQTPGDLVKHNCILGSVTGNEWQYRDRDGTDTSVRVGGRAVVTSGDALREAAVSGLGVVRGTWWLHRKDLESGAVTEILRDYRTVGTSISVLYPANRHVPAKVRTFLDFLVEITRQDSPGVEAGRP